MSMVEMLGSVLSSRSCRKESLTPPTPRDCRVQLCLKEWFAHSLGGAFLFSNYYMLSPNSLPGLLGHQLVLPEYIVLGLKVFPSAFSPLNSTG